MTKSEALKLFKWKYYDAHEILGDDLDPLLQGFQYLCTNMPKELKDKWDLYWIDINKDHKKIIKQYDETLDNDELYLLRLLTAIWFIEDTYKD